MIYTTTGTRNMHFGVRGGTCRRMILDGISGCSTSLRKRADSKSCICTIFGENSMAAVAFLSKQVLKRF